MKLLVTGGLGFIGSNFVRYYLEKHPGDRIVNLDRCTYAGNPANLDGMRGKDRHLWVRGDIANPKVADRCMRGVEKVVHFAAETHVDRSIFDGSVFLRTNVIGTKVLLDAALRHGVKRFLHISTDEVYGSVPRGSSKETDALLPNSPYSAAKAASDHLVRSYHATYGLDAVITRCSNNFGPYQYPEKALPLMITNWLSGEPFPLYGEGRNVRDWIFVLDHVRAIELLLRKGKSGEVYNIGGTASLENRRLVEMARGLMGVPKSLVRKVPDRLGHDLRYAVDCGKLKRLGFKHAFSFEEALKTTIVWYKSNEAWWRGVKDKSHFKRYYLRQYKTLVEK